jgi:hypothetical protein
LGKRKAKDRKVLIKAPTKMRKKGEEEDEEQKDDLGKDPSLDQVNQDISKKNLPGSDKNGIDPFLLRIDKLDKLELAPVEEQEDNEKELDTE